MGSFLLVLTVTALFAAAAGMRTSGLAKPALCAPDIVQETCSFITGDATRESVDADDLQAILSANQDSIVQAWQALGLHGRATMITRSSKVTCAELCEAILAAAAEQHMVLPPSSDLGCYVDAGKVICDVDLSPERISKLVPANMEIPDMHDDEVVVKHKAAEPAKKVVKWPPFDREAKQRAAEELAYTVEQVTERLANLFRMFVVTETQSLLQTGKFENISSPGSMSWRIEVAKRNLEAEGYVNQAIRQFKSRRSRDAITKWFGPGAFKDSAIIKEVQRVLNSVHEMIDNVEYVYPGGECKDDVYAYVYPTGAQSVNHQGQYIFHLCDLYMTSPTSVQIETLTHEASHHATAYTTDVCMDDAFYVKKPKAQFYFSERTQAFNVDGRSMEVVHETKDEVIFEPVDEDCDRTAYGRSTCMSLAKDFPDFAILNADSFCYYIQEVTVEAKTGSSSKARRMIDHVEMNP